MFDKLIHSIASVISSFFLLVLFSRIIHISHTGLDDGSVPGKLSLEEWLLVELFIWFLLSIAAYKTFSYFKRKYLEL